MATRVTPIKNPETSSGWRRRSGGDVIDQLEKPVPLPSFLLSFPRLPFRSIITFICFRCTTPRSDLRNRENLRLRCELKGRFWDLIFTCDAKPSSMDWKQMLLFLFDIALWSKLHDNVIQFSVTRSCDTIRVTWSCHPDVCSRKLSNVEPGLYLDGRPWSLKYVMLTHSNISLF